MRRVWAVVRLEPVRVWAYGVVLPGFGVLLVYGVVSGAQAAAWLALAAGVLGVPGAELVRSKVSPTIARPRATGGPVSSGGPVILGDQNDQGQRELFMPRLCDIAGCTCGGRLS